LKILVVDIETSPNTAYVWGIWQENIPLARLKETSQVLCWSAKWLGDSEIKFDSIHKSSKKRMLQRIHKLLDEADAVVTFNGDKFDIPVLNREFLVAGMPPPAPYKSIDVYKTVKTRFRFISNKMTFISQQLGLGEKIETEFELWVKCMQKDSAAWAEMEAYNKHDVTILEQNYYKILPWIKGHINRSTFTGDLVCPNCGSNHFQRRGYHLTSAGKYQRFQCNDCGHWFRGNKNEGAKKEKFITCN
jgi:predicted RNA-binding Zn-ribbon protein involved in translation (DUF1610 family)